MKSKVTPAEKIVILKNAGIQQTKSGLALPDTSERSKPELGIVTAIGKGKKPLEFKKGDTIVYRKYMDNKINVLGEELNMIDFKDILGVLEQ